MANKKRTSPITPAMIIAARGGLSQAKAAELAGISPRILKYYESGKVAMTTAAFTEFEKLVNTACNVQ